MQPTATTTGFARLSPPAARGVLLLAAVATCLLVMVTFSPMAGGRVGKPARGKGDVALYRAEVERIGQGEGYYQAVATELRERGYPTKSVFNWRTPLPVWLIGVLPSPAMGKAILGMLCLALVMLVFDAICREDDNRIGRAVACVLLLSGPLLFCVIGDLFVMPVLWAGVLIALSIAAYGAQRPWLGFATGLAAVFFRELALPYCLVAAVLAYRDGRRKETIAWAVGLSVFLLLFAAHCLYVGRLILPTDRAHAQSWISFGGAGFVIAITQMNAYLMMLPQWVTALYLAMALVGFAGWNTPLGQRAGLTACLFLAGMALVGQNFNQYWGCLLAPLMCLGVARFPASIRDLFIAARPRKLSPASVENC